jgi:hypothetical protein
LIDCLLVALAWHCSVIGWWTCTGCQLGLLLACGGDRAVAGMQQVWLLASRSVTGSKASTTFTSMDMCLGLCIHTLHMCNNTAGVFSTKMLPLQHYKHAMTYSLQFQGQASPEPEYDDGG